MGGGNHVADATSAESVVDPPGPGQGGGVADRDVGGEVHDRFAAVVQQGEGLEVEQVCGLGCGTESTHQVGVLDVAGHRHDVMPGGDQRPDGTSSQDPGGTRDGNAHPTILR